MHGSFTKYDEGNLFRATAQWAQRSKTAETVAAYSWHPVGLVFPHHVVNDISARVSPNFFDLLGNKAALGRLFTPVDETNCTQCVVITDRLWKAEFNSDRNIVGKTISVDGRSGTVIGVLPESFVFIFPEVSVWLLPGWGTSTNNFADRTGAVLRMQPQATLAQAKQEFGQMADKDGYSQPQSVHPLVGPFSTWLFLVTAMIALSWSLYDQGRRCRFCLRRLGNEASVGTPGYLFLGWWGTELVCSDGHGLLHVPEMKSSWQEFDQWVSLDESWKPLFEHEEPVHTP
jgi:hypothetical protein